MVNDPPRTDDIDHPDVYLGRLADRRIDVHRLVAEIIDRPNSQPNRLHRAIVKLAASHPSPRVVTTNYDLHLTSAAAGIALQLPVYEAPALPVGDDFDGIVHLHGSLNQEARRLVLTDRDFGQAYLRDAWAARFLERMFATFTVMFVGYSHGDVVMQYLARSLGPPGRRYVFTDTADDPSWRRLGLTPVSYPNVDGSHSALPGCLERWASRATMGETDHRRQVAELVASEPSMVPEDVSYLEEVLEHPVRIGYFVEKARGASWFAWVVERSAFQALFDQDSVNPSATSTLTQWVVDNYVTVPSLSPLALRAMRDKAWTPATCQTIIRGLLSHHKEMDASFAPWLVIALQHTRDSRDDMLDVLLAEHGWSNDVSLAILLFENRTRPILKSGFNFGGDVLPRFDSDLAGDEYWLTKAWSDAFIPMLPNHLAPITDMISEQIVRLYRTQGSVANSRDFDPLSFRRSAIEPHGQDRFREAIDVLIDGARDCIEYALANDVSLADRFIDGWADSDYSLLRRFAIHAWRVRTDRSSDEKIEWLASRNWLWEMPLQHEVFLLLRDAIPEASDALIATTIESIVAGPATDSQDDDDLSAYRSYNLLAWLNSSPGTRVLITTAFDAFQAAHPDYAQRDHPDLNSYVTVGSGEEAQPYSTNELHALIAENPSATVCRIKQYRAQHSAEPARTGALRSLQQCVATYPADGLALGRVLDSRDDDFRAAIIDGWDAADLGDVEARAVLTEVKNWDPDAIRQAAVRMLSNGGSEDHRTAWHMYGEARAIAMSLWPSGPSSGDVYTDGDLLTAAINHPAGQLARFWTKVVQWEWTEAGDTWDGLSNELSTELERMLNTEGRNGLLASTYLASQLHFYYGADPKWTASHVLPLLDWNGSEERASSAWRGFLFWGRWNDGLLGAGLLNAYLATCGHSDTLDSDRQNALAGHLASIAMYSGTEPTRWLPSFVSNAPEHIRARWTEQIAHILSDSTPDESEEQWERWISTYWSNRVRSVPLPLTIAEASAMASWLIGLPTVRNQAVSLLVQTPAGLPEHVGFLYRIHDFDLTADATSWATAITHILRGTQGAEPFAIHYLKDIVQQLREANPAPDVSDLINEAMRLGATDAPDW